MLLLCHGEWLSLSFIYCDAGAFLPASHPSIHPCADGLTHSDSTAKRHFFHSGIKFAGSLETARNVTLPIIPWSLRQAGSLMARLENAAPSSSCHCKLSREPWIIRPFCLRQHYRARRVPWEPSPSAPRIFLPPPPRLNYTIASPVRDILYDLKQRLGHRKCLMIGRL